MAVWMATAFRHSERGGVLAHLCRVCGQEPSGTGARGTGHHDPRRHPSSGKYPAGPPRSRRGRSWRQSPKDPKKPERPRVQDPAICRSEHRDNASSHFRRTRSRDLRPGYAPVASACIRDRRPARVRNRVRRRCAITVTGFGRHRKSGRLLQIARGEAGVPYCMRSEHPRRSRGRLRTTRSIPRW